MVLGAVAVVVSGRIRRRGLRQFTVFQSPRITMSIVTIECRPWRGRAWTPAALVQLLTMVLMVAVFGSLAVHHSASDETVAPVLSIVAAFGEVPEPEAPGLSGAEIATSAVQTSDDGWLGVLVSGCAALGLICVLGLALFRRAGSAHRVDSPGTLVRTPWLCFRRWESRVALAVRPSLDVLSISRT
jgi:hypothetical protein